MKALHKLILTITLTLLYAGIVHGQLVIDGHLAVLDSLTSTYLCPISRTHFSSDFTARITAQGLDALTIEGTPITGDSTFTFQEVTGGKKWTIEANEGETHVTRQLTFTYLPVVVMNGNCGYDYTNCTLQVLDPDNYSSEVMLSKIKWRGASTNVDGKHKRNYHIKFLDENGEKMDRKFFGLRNDNSWILDAGQVDFLRVRNRVATELWNDMCTKPYYANREPKAKTGVGGKMVEIILNGNYAGIYALTEAMDRKLLKLKKYNEASLEIHGQLWKTTNYTTTTSFNVFKPYDNSSAQWLGFETKYPELDEVAPTDYKVLADGVYMGDTTTLAQSNMMLHLTHDVPVMIDYTIFTQALLAIDNQVKNIYWFTYDRTTDSQLSLAVWDLDTSMGGNWTTEQFHPSTVSPTRDYGTPNSIFYRVSCPGSRYYRDYIKRYHELRGGVLGTDSLIARYTHAVQNIDLCGAIDREQQRWSGDSDLNGHKLDIRNELAYVTQWIKTRMDFLDNGRFKKPLEGDINADGQVDIVDVNAVINTILFSDFYKNPVCDINGDNVVDITDVNCVINIILKNKLTDN